MHVCSCVCVWSRASLLAAKGDDSSAAVAAGVTDGEGGADVAETTGNAGVGAPSDDPDGPPLDVSTVEPTPMAQVCACVFLCAALTGELF